MPPISAERRTVLRRRLLALASAHDIMMPDRITSQIEALLEEVFEGDDPLAEPMPLRLDKSDEDQRIVVTGMGLVTAFGIGPVSFWDGLSAGRSPVARITLCDPSGFPCQIAAEVPGFTPQEYMDAKEARRMSRASQFAVASARLALADAGLSVDDGNRHDIGTVIGCGTSSLPDVEQTAYTLFTKGPERVSPFAIPMQLPNMPASQVAIQLGITGYNSTIASACAASAQAIGEAAALIRRGDAEVLLAGGTEAPISRFSLAGFCAMRALSSRNDEPQRASRPFDSGRDGFVPAEGSALLVLERLSSARRRGAKLYAELIGYASTCDAHHVTAPDPQGHGAARAIRRALANARISPQQVDYINAHATSTAAGDIAETRAIRHVFDEYAYSVPISATKSMLGHPASAAGAIEAAATILALKHNLIPPTINLEQPDPECDLDYVPNQARPATLEIAISNSFAFGGVNAVLVFRKIR